MRVFLAGATGVVGQRLVALLRDAKHDVTGTTRTQAKAAMLRALGITPAVVDVFDPDALAQAIAAARPDVIIHQLTNLPSAPGTPGYAAAQEANRRLRIEGTRNLMLAAKMAGVRRVVAQSIAFVYAPGEGAHSEDDPLDVAAEGVRQLTVQGIIALERQVLQTLGITGVVLRYGYFYGPGTWYEMPPKPPSVHVDAAANAALLAVTRGAGVYNIVEDDGAVSSAKARGELGFDPAFRIPERLARELRTFRSSPAR
jgi:nucleoside-diphosphate-sugar epimerase